MPILLAEQGQGEEGIAQICQGLAAWRATGAELVVPYYLGLLAESYGKVGQPEKGLSVLAEALAAVDKSEERRWEDVARRKTKVEVYNYIALLSKT